MFPVAKSVTVTPATVISFKLNQKNKKLQFIYICDKINMPLFLKHEKLSQIRNLLQNV